MSEFDYLSRITIGQYLPTGSIIHRLDARARIIGFLLILGAVTFTTSPLGLAIGIAVILCALWIGRIPIGYTLRGLIAPLPFLLILAVLQLVVNFKPDVPPILFQWGPITISPADIWAAIILLMRFSELILGLSLASFCMSTSEMIHGLEFLLAPFTKLGLPAYDLVMVLQVTLRYLPFLAQAAERIAKAQASRGAEWTTGRGGPLRRARQVIPLIVPLFLISLRRAENMALAMDARGYGQDIRRTSMFEMHFRLGDGFAVLLAAILAALILLA
jgi:energy-coupling factor transport system permease protein